nr:retrovirus-related Pol polyprotein from transposon TNT 1-94 [Tanacetum cinerariifolium]
MKDIHLMNIFILMSLLKEDTSAQNTIPILTPPLPIPSMVTLAPQDKWSQDKHIELVNIIGNLEAEMLTRAMAKQLSATSAHECLFVDFLYEEEPKKDSGFELIRFSYVDYAGCKDTFKSTSGEA